MWPYRGTYTWPQASVEAGEMHWPRDLFYVFIDTITWLD